MALGRTRRPGLRALMEISGVAPGELSEQSLGFRLGPRINAAGRMQRADAALELLLTDDDARAGEVARELDLLNRDRQEAETRILFAAEAACAPQAHEGAIVVAGEGWHPGVVGIVASRLVERWRRPCVVIALDGQGGGRGSGRSISAYDLHAGLGACSEHLTRFGGHRMAAGVELDAAAIEPFRRALAAHAAAALSPDDLIPVERVDAVVPGGDLGLDLADDLERLRPFGMGNPQPTLLVPAARFERGDRHGGGQGALALHARGRGRREVARRGLRLAAQGAGPGGRPRPRHRPPARAQPLERDGGAARDPEGALPDRGGRARRPRARTPPSGTSSAPCSARPTLSPTATPPLRPASSRTAAARASPELRVTSSRAASPCWWRWRTCRAAAPASRPWWRASPTGRWRSPPGRRSKRIPRSPRASTTWSRSTRRRPAKAMPCSAASPRAHLAWGPAEAEFALTAWRAELDLRPQLAEIYRALRELPPEASGPDLETALRGACRYPRNARACARLARVLTELSLIELDPAARTCRVLDAVRSDLERSPTYRASREALTAIERALAPAALAA